MARYSKGINGPFQGKLGTVVGCRWKNVDYLRSLPKPSTKPDTARKKNSKSSFAFIHHWLNPINDLIRIGFDAVNPGRTARMSAHSYNALNALSGQHPHFEIDYSKARFSLGTLPPSPGASVELVDHQTLQINWDSSCDGSVARPTDNLLFFVYCPDIGDAIAEAGAARRQDGSIRIALYPTMVNQRLEVQIAFKSVMDNSVSESQYAGRIIASVTEGTSLFAPEAEVFCAAVSADIWWVAGK